MIPSQHLPILYPIQSHFTKSRTLKMSTSINPFCLGTISPRKPAIVSSFSPTKNEVQISQLSESSTLKPFNIISSIPSTTNNTVVRRREAIGFGLGLCFLLFPEWCNVANAAETTPCDFTLTQSGLAYCDKAVGYGSEPSKGQLIKAHYVGKLENGTVFDSSYNRGKPLTFRIGVGEVIKGWDQGILGGDGVPPMLAGGKRSLKIPPELGYGARGAGCKGGKCIIPPDSVLLFDVEYIGKG